MVNSRMFRNLPLALLVLVPAASVGGCSLTSVVDIRVGQCPGANAEGHRRCQEVLNPIHGYYEGCAAFKCVELDDYFQCQKVDGEICDGEDNDCDYLIDEPEESEALMSAEARDLVSGIEEVTSLSLAESESFGRSLYVQESRGSLFQVSLDGEGSATSKVTLRTQKADPNPSSQSELTTLQDGCYPASGATAGNACTTDQAVTKAGEKVAFFAYVNGQGCTSGELRVGVVDRTHPDEFIDRGLGARAPSYRGVATFGTRCSSNLSLECESLKAGEDADPSDLSRACGVKSPSIAALSDQALVTYLGSKLSDEDCPAEETNVLALGLFESHATFDSTIYWANPSDDGRPAIIGQTRSFSEPGTVSIGDTGFMVAHGAAKGKIRLVWVPKQKPPKDVAGISCPDDDCESRKGVGTAPLEGIEELLVLSGAEGGLADGIGMTLLDLGKNSVGLLLTWVDGCAAGAGDFDRKAYAQLLHVDTSGTTPTIEKSFDPVSLGRVRRPPVAVAASDHFVVEGLERNGQQAEDDRLGGFYVLLQDSASTAVRVAAFDGQLVDDDERIPLKDWAYLSPLEPDTLLAHDESAFKIKRVELGCHD